MDEQKPDPGANGDDAEQEFPLTVFVFPREGGPGNATAIPLSETAVMSLLSSAQMGMHAYPCPIEDCENCNLTRLVWWDTCNALSPGNRVALQAWLTAEGYGLPDAPWEEIEPDGTPYPRDFVQ